MRTPTDSAERVGRTRLRLSPGSGAGRCRVRSVTTPSDATASVIRPVVVDHGARHARVALVPEGALLLAGDAIELDVTVDAGLRLELIEPGGTVAFDMRGGEARWDVRVEVAAGAGLRWSGQPFVVSAGARVTRTVRARLGAGGRLALREQLVLGRHGEVPGVLHQASTVVDGDGRPLLVEELVLNPDTVPLLLGGRRVVDSVVSFGGGAALGATPLDDDRYDLHAPGAVLWRRLGDQAHEADLSPVWRALGPLD